ncbi:cellulase family glycosylhydrolase [Kiritimatiella glycovorans]|uniref:Putative endoglycoceramidase n=1 Tax=Kiritimatiella glycovorans TaxID=1307763 RepID=A0A0G3ECW6_9BACT|nr:cellulase family glycosylhydrolase [Kiritimatiella glycovorans]AKJ64163.1 putative endoglycoceramidase [Kiritimatiella glycovorans]
MRTGMVMVMVLFGGIHMGRAEETRVPDFDPPPPTMKLTAEPSEDWPEVVAPEGLPARPWFRDEHGRHFIPNGFVVNTEDVTGDYTYPESSYARTRAYGFNVQVIRLGLTRLGGFPGSELKQSYLDKIDRMVRLGKENGLKTIFKLTLYDLTGEVYTDLTEDHWAALFLNRDGLQDRYVDAWAMMFERYADEPAVWGYDLLNEPLAATGGARKNIWEVYEDFKDNEHFQTEYFWPLYERVIDRLHSISPEKWALVQSWHYTVANHRKTGLPSGYPLTNLDRERVVYAPHYYGAKPNYALQTYLNHAGELGLPVIIGEYGPPTFPNTDEDLETQLVYELNFMRTVNLFDRFGIGMLKAWWSGSRDLENGVFNRTWAMFHGPSHALGPERKYVVDVMCRPRPIYIAGVAHTWHYDFATREFTLDFTPGPASAPSEIYLPLDRHYEDGLRIFYHDLVMKLDPGGKGGLSVLENPAKMKTRAFSWDKATQRLYVKTWPGVKERTSLKVLPGVQD